MDQQTTYNILVEKLKNIPKAQVRSLSLAVLPRLMGALHNHSVTCPNCKKYSQEGEEFVHNIQQLFADDKKTMQHFENWVEESQKHLKTKHHLQVKGRITSTYATIGMIIGVVLPAFYLWLTNAEDLIGYISLGWVVGMLAGYITGKVTENRLRKNNKLY